MKKNSRQYRELAADELKLLQEWQHFAILTLLQAPNFLGDAEHIAKRFNLSVSVVKESLEILLRLGLIQSVGRSYRCTSENFTTTTQIPSTVLRGMHARNLEIAQGALQRIPVDWRDFSSISFTFDASQIAAAKEELQRMRRKFVEKFSTGRKQTEVYNLNMQFFPLTHLDGVVK